MKILSSASKIVFILMCGATITGLFLNKIDPKDFMVLASMAFTFYFSNKGDANSTGGDMPYLGK
jgi:hypothetical protein